MPDPTIIRHDGVDVYAPRCETCGSDQNTKWLYLPGDPVDVPFFSDRGHALCHNCDADFYTSIEEAYRAREPERLAERLAELKAEAGRG